MIVGKYLIRVHFCFKLEIFQDRLFKFDSFGIIKKIQKMSLGQSQSLEANKKGQIVINEQNSRSQVKSKFRRRRAKLILDAHRYINQMISEQNPSQGFLSIELNSQQRQKVQNQKPPRKAQITKLEDYNTQKFPQARPYQECQICFADFETSKLLSISNCKHKFCSQCLKGHLKAQITMNKIALCPDKDCTQEIDALSPFLKQLTKTEQQKYYNIQVYNTLSNNQTIKICPTQNCEGFINIKQKPIICPICVISFCQKCLFPKHNGLCDQNAGLFLEDNYNFRKCQKCKMILQKNKGCNHMTCKCRHQFCYLCGKTWANKHKCDQVQANIMRNQQPNSPINITIPNNTISRPLQRQNTNIQIQQNHSICNNTCCSSLKTKLSCLIVNSKKTVGIIFFFILCFAVCFPIVLILFLINRFLSGCKQFATYSWKQQLFLNIFLYLYCFAKRIPYDCENRQQCFGIFRDCLINRLNILLNNIVLKILQ